MKFSAVFRRSNKPLVTQTREEVLSFEIPMNAPHHLLSERLWYYIQQPLVKEEGNEERKGSQRLNRDLSRVTLSWRIHFSSRVTIVARKGCYSFNFRGSRLMNTRIISFRSVNSSENQNFPATRRFNAPLHCPRRAYSDSLGCSDYEFSSFAAKAR